MMLLEEKRRKCFIFKGAHWVRPQKIKRIGGIREMVRLIGDAFTGKLTLNLF